jgi:hypothetical protein
VVGYGAEGVVGAVVVGEGGGGAVDGGGDGPRDQQVVVAYGDTLFEVAADPDGGVGEDRFPGR